jgi:hypothetical protein
MALSLLRGTTMKKLATVIAAIALIETPAFAQAPLPAPAQVYNWTGWYVGGNVGASFGTFKTDFNASGTVSNSPGAGPGFFLPALLAPTYCIQAVSYNMRI